MTRNIKMLYGIASIGESGLYNLMGTFGLFFLTTLAGIDPVTAGTITAAGSVWQTVCGILVGHISDNCNLKLGKRRTFILLAAVPLTVFSSLFFTEVDLPQQGKLVYYTIVLMIFWASFATFYVPYLTWGSELTQDYHERTSLRGYAYFFGVIGSSMGLMLPNLMVDWLVTAGRTQSQAWQMTGLIISIIGGAAILVSAGAIKDDSYSEKTEKKEKQPGQNMLGNYFQLLKLRTVRYILAASITYLIAYSIFCATRMYFLTYNMDLSGVIISIVMFIHTFASVIFLPLIGALNKRFDKRYTYAICLMISACGLAGFGLAGLTTVTEILILSVAYCIGNLAYWQLMPSMIYDVSEVDQLINNKQRGGAVMSFQVIAEAVGTAAGLQITGFILGLSGFNGEAAVQTETALYWTNMAFTIIPATLILISVLCIIRYPVTRAMHVKVVEALKGREEGKSPDMEQFHKL